METDAGGAGGFFFAPIVAKIPPTTDKTIKTATSVPPRIAPAMELMISRIPGTLLLAVIEIAPRMITMKENTTPPQPRPKIVLAPPASKALPRPPTSNVAPAAKIPKMPAMRAIMPPAFFMIVSPFPKQWLIVPESYGVSPSVTHSPTIEYTDQLARLYIFYHVPPRVA